MLEVRKQNRLIKTKEHIFDLIETFIKDYDSTVNDDEKGYLIFRKRDDDSLDISIGLEKFSIIAKIQGGTNNVIIFNVFHWEFDISYITRYRLDHIKELTFAKIGSTVQFITPIQNQNGETWSVLCQLNGQNEIIMVDPLLTEFERYMLQKLEKLYPNI